VVAGRTYDRVVVTGNVQIGPGAPATTFTNCRIEGAVVTSSTFNLDSCTVTGGFYGTDTGGTINRSLLQGGNAAFRPATSSAANVFTTRTPWVMTNTYLQIPQGVAPAHTESAQVLGGVGITFRNVVFDTGGPFNNTQTADLSFWGKDMLCEDCRFVGYGGYAIYSDGPNNVFVRPRFARTHPFGLVFPTSGSRIAPVLVDSRYVDGTPT
jgi:hypothetical protein